MPHQPCSAFLYCVGKWGKEGPSVTDSSRKQQKGTRLCPGQLEVERGRWALLCLVDYSVIRRVPLHLVLCRGVPSGGSWKMRGTTGMEHALLWSCLRSHTIWKWPLVLFLFLVGNKPEKKMKYSENIVKPIHMRTSYLTWDSCCFYLLGLNV